MPTFLKQCRSVMLGLCMLALLSACQSTPVSKSPFNAAQIAVLTEQGFRQTDEGWELSFTDKLLFDFNASNLTSSSRLAIQKISAALLQVDITHMQIEGHTDNEGKEAYNNKLSVARASMVANAMAAAGVPRANLVIRGLGMSKPVASNATREGQAENRRVSIIVSAP